MEKRTRRAALTLAVSLAGAVPGCDSYGTYRRCGLYGCPEDQRITAEIKALIGEHPELLAPNMVYVQTQDGVGYLSGQVATGLQRTTAEELAHQPQGVRRVVDLISLTYR
jgi:osmotically-inducible protein OsmY